VVKHFAPVSCIADMENNEIGISTWNHGVFPFHNPVPNRPVRGKLLDEKSAL
jgi:hypothetical protein